MNRGIEKFRSCLKFSFTSDHFFNLQLSVCRTINACSSGVELGMVDAWATVMDSQRAHMPFGPADGTGLHLRWIL